MKVQNSWARIAAVGGLFALATLLTITTCTSADQSHTDGDEVTSTPQNEEESADPSSPPASLLVTASPEDALITIDGGLESTGVLEVGEIPEGDHRIRVSRPGYEPREKVVALVSDHLHTLEISLEPREFAVDIDVYPAADYEILRHGETLHRGETPLSHTLPAGKVTIAIEREDYQPFERAFHLDRSVEKKLYLDRPGQLLRRTGKFRSGGSPKASHFSRDGSEIWVARLMDKTAGVKVLDARTGESVADVDLDGAGAVELAMSDDGKKVYASQMETARVFEIDAHSKKVLRTFETGSSWTKVLELSSDESFLLASNWVGNDVSLIDLDTGELERRIPTVDTPRGLYLTSGGNTLYVAGFDNGELQRIDLETGESEIIFDRGGSLRHIAADEWSGKMFISDLRYNLIWQMDMDTEEVSLFTRPDFSPNTIVLDPSAQILFVSCRGRTHPSGNYYKPGHEWGSVLLYDTEDATLLDAIVGGNQPTGLDVTADGRRLVFSNFLDSNLEVYDVPSYETLRAGGGGRADVYRRELAKH